MSDEPATVPVLPTTDCYAGATAALWQASSLVESTTWDLKRIVDYDERRKHGDAKNTPVSLGNIGELYSYLANCKASIDKMSRDVADAETHLSRIDMIRADELITAKRTTS
jgi:hypothetical protein